jgi:hypothetical protein
MDTTGTLISSLSGKQRRYPQPLIVHRSCAQTDAAGTRLWISKCRVPSRPFLTQKPSWTRTTLSINQVERVLCSTRVSAQSIHEVSRYLEFEKKVFYRMERADCCFQPSKLNTFATGSRQWDLEMNSCLSHTRRACSLLQVFSQCLSGSLSVQKS